MSDLLEIFAQQRAGARVVTIRGELDLNEADAVRAALKRATSEPARRLVIDLSDCDFIDSTGLATIVHATRPMRDGGISVALVCPPGAVRKLLEISALDLTFPIADRLDEALASPPSGG